MPTSHTDHRGTEERVVAAIYDAALCPERWDEALLAMGAALRGKAGIAAMDPRTRAPRYVVAPGVPPSFEEHSRADEAWIRGIGQRPVGTLVTAEEILPQFCERPWVAELRHETGLCVSGGGMLAVEPELFAGAFVLRPPRRAVLRGPDRAACERLFSHLRHGLLLRHRLADLDLQRRAALDVLQLLPTAVIFVDHHCRVVYANARGEALLAAGDGLRLARGLLVAATPAQTAALRALLGRAAAAGARRCFDAGGALALQRPSGKPPLLARVAPLGDQPHRPRAVQPVAVLFVTDPAAQVLPQAVVLQQVFGLTPAEARVALLAAEGHGLGRAADALQIARNTARTHQQRAFAKTGTRRQAELARLLAALAIATAPPAAR